MINARALFYGGGFALGLVIGCATPSTTPPVTHYLLAGPAPQFAEQVEVLKGTLIQLRSGDILLEAQAQLIEDSVGVQFYVINLSGRAIRLDAHDFSLIDAQGAACRSLQIKEMLVEKKSMDHGALAPTNAYGGSTNDQMAKTLRGEKDRLQKTLERPFVGAEVPVNTKISGMLYFERPAAWPVEFKVHAAGQVLAASFSRAVVNP